MKKVNILTLLSFVFLSSFVLHSCKDDDNEQPIPTPTEFIADDNTFKDFMSWSLDATNQGPDPALGMAHAGNDSTVTRMVYFKDGQEPVNGKYPLGTIIVKHSKNPYLSVNEFTAMVKRGNNFASSGGDWEWFMLAPDGTIATDGDGNPMRGANLMGGMCVSCHTQASATDFVFSK